MYHLRIYFYEIVLSWLEYTLLLLFSFLKPDRLGGSRAALDEEEDGDTVSFLLSSCPTTAGRFCAHLGLSLPGGNSIGRQCCLLLEFKTSAKAGMSNLEDSLVHLP